MNRFQRVYIRFLIYLALSDHTYFFNYSMGSYMK